MPTTPLGLSSWRLIKGKLLRYRVSIEDWKIGEMTMYLELIEAAESVCFVLVWELFIIMALLLALGTMHHHKISRYAAQYFFSSFAIEDPTSDVVS